MCWSNSLIAGDLCVGCPSHTLLCVLFFFFFLVLRLVEYVSCNMCRNPETSLTRDSVTRLYFIQCESCGSRRSVAPIKTGFHATMRTDRRKVKAAV